MVLLSILLSQEAVAQENNKIWKTCFSSCIVQYDAGNVVIEKYLVMLGVKNDKIEVTKTARRKLLEDIPNTYFLNLNILFWYFWGILKYISARTLEIVQENKVEQNYISYEKRDNSNGI